MRTLTAGTLLLASLTIGGCAGHGTDQSAADPNVTPVNYRNQIALFLTTELTDPADFHGALISAPALKPVSGSQRMVVCVRFNGHNERKDKVAIYFAGSMAQFVEAKPEQCADAVYQPFPELVEAIPEAPATMLHGVPP